MQGGVETVADDVRARIVRHRFYHDVRILLAKGPDQRRDPPPPDLQRRTDPQMTSRRAAARANLRLQLIDVVQDAEDAFAEERALLRQQEAPRAAIDQARAQAVCY